MSIPVNPHLFPGRLHPTNKYAQSWGWQGFIAYGAFSYIVVIEPHSLRILQTLDEHQDNISCIRWAPKDLDLRSESKKTTRINPVKLLLATGDTGGTVLIWNVLQANVCRSINEVESSVQQMEWIDSQYLAILYSNGIFLLWGVKENKILWRKNFEGESISYFNINPFNSNQVIFGSSLGWIFFTTGINSNEPPSIISKYRIATPIESTSTSYKALKQITYSPSNRNLIYFVLHKEIIIYDSEVNMSVGNINIDRGRSPFAQLQLRKTEPNLLFCLHENGSISAWRKHNHSYKYEFRSMWELQRFTKQNKKTNVSIYSILDGTQSHQEITMFANDGTLWLWNYKQSIEKSSFCITGLMETISSPVCSLGVRSFSKGNDYVTSTIAALGTHSGTLQILNLKSNEIESEFSISPFPLRCIRWLNQYTVIGFSTEELSGQDAGCYRNYLHIVDIRNGKVSKIRSDKGIEVTCIRNIKVSYSRKYFVILLRDRPFELWDAQLLSFIRTGKLPNDQQITSFAWSPIIRQHSTPQLAGTSERFVVTTGNGQFHHFSVQKAILSLLFSHTEPDLATITAIAWKDNYVVSGDSNGNVAIWDYESRKTRVIQTNSKRVRGIRFAPSKNQHHVLIIFKLGHFCIWDVENCTKLSNSNYLRNRDIKAIEGGWLDDSHPVIATSDGCLRIMDRTFSNCNSPFSFKYQETLQHITKPLYNPYILPGKQQLILKVILQHGEFDALKTFPSLISSDNTQHLIIPSKILLNIKSALTIPDRCLLVAKYFNDIEEIEFWTLVTHAFINSSLINNNKDENMNTENEINDEIEIEIENPISNLEEDENENNNMKETEEENKETNLEKELNDTIIDDTSIIDDTNIVKDTNNTDNQENISNIESVTNNSFDKLLPHYNLLRTPKELHYEEEEKALSQKKNLQDLQHRKYNIDKLLYLRNNNAAIDNLLQTNTQDEKYLQDALMACVVAAAESKTAFHSVVQIVAGNLIAQNRLNEGIQLLLLVNRGVEACQHLQSRGKWDEAALLAKLNLPPNEIEIVYICWCNELVKQEEYHKAITILLTFNMYHEVLQILREWGKYHTAALFYKALEESNLLIKETETSRIRKIPFISPKFLKESIFMDYGIYLLELSAKDQYQADLKEYITLLDKDNFLTHLQSQITK